MVEPAINNLLLHFNRIFIWKTASIRSAMSFETLAYMLQSLEFGLSGREFFENIIVSELIMISGAVHSNQNAIYTAKET